MMTGGSRYVTLADVPHARTLPSDDLSLALLVYQLRSAKTPAAQKLVAEYFMGQEDGMYPDGPGWGPPAPVAARQLRRAYAKQYRWGYRLYLASVAATPEQLQAALRIMVHHYGQEWQSLADPVRIVAGIEAHYRKYRRTRKGWKGFLKDIAGDEQDRAAAELTYTTPLAPIGLQADSIA
jgi:hypothetical protein